MSRRIRIHDKIDALLASNTETRAILSELVSRMPRPREAKPYGALPGEAEILELIRAMRQDGKTLEQVATALNEAGYRTRRGHPWRLSYVAKAMGGKK